MRGIVPRLRSPFPLVEGLPAVFQGDPVTTDLLATLDEVVAPVHATLDCLDAYLDPRMTPGDFLPWLAGWVGLDPLERWSDAQLRSLMAVSIGLYRTRGTAAGVAGLVEAYTGTRPIVTDSGSVTVVPRREPNDGSDVVTELGFDPHASDPWVRIEVTVPSDAEGDLRSITPAHILELIRPAVPAHVRVLVTVELATGTR